MADTVRPAVGWQVIDGIAVITLDSGRINAVDGRLRTALGEALDRTAALRDLRAIVLTAAGAHFSAGATVRDLDHRPTGPGLAGLARRIEEARVPVVAALPGPALGAGAELALACHWRLAAPGAGIGFPEIRLGLLPRAGGIQRLTRIAGVATALEMLFGGAALPPEAALRQGLVDGVVQGDVREAGLTLARELLARDAAPRPSSRRREGLADPAANVAMIRAARAAARGDPRQVAPLILGCIEAALVLPFAQGLAYEAEAHLEAAAQPQSRALRHLVLAGRRQGAAVFDGQGRPRPVAAAAAERVLEAMTRAAVLLAEDTGPAAVDAALVAEGFEEGPFGGRTAAPAPGLWRAVLVAAMAEGARIIEEGLLPSADAVDLAAVHAGGFARLTGGPMWAGQALGLRQLLAETRSRTAAPWAVPRVLADAARAGRWP